MYCRSWAEREKQAAYHLSGGIVGRSEFGVTWYQQGTASCMCLESVGGVAWHIHSSRLALEFCF